MSSVRFIAPILRIHFRKNKKGFLWVILARVITIISCTPQHIVLQKEFHQIFHLSNKKISRKKILRDLSFNRMNNFEKIDLLNIVHEHCFYVTLADFEQIINNDFIQLEAE